jgi:hypothetical protein
VAGATVPTVRELLDLAEDHPVGQAVTEAILDLLL